MQADTKNQKQVKERMPTTASALPYLPINTGAWRLSCLSDAAYGSMVAIAVALRVDAMNNEESV